MVTIRPFGRMTIEPAFYALPNVQQMAVMVHEAGHKARGHLWKRFIARFILSPAAYSAFLHRQEFEADAFAKRYGHASALANVLRRYPEPESFTHPASKERIARLLA